MGFLFCEELYVAENCRINGTSISLYSDLIVFHDEHSSISKLKKSIIAQHARESLEFVLQKFFVEK